MTLALAEALGPVFTEVVVAPGYDDDALALLTASKNLRVLGAPAPAGDQLDVRSIDGGLLVQEPDRVRSTAPAGRWSPRWRPPRRSGATWCSRGRSAPRCSSNAIVLANGRQAVGIGAGQQNRVDSAGIAATKAAGRAQGGVAASDAFFPFRDGLDTVAAAGVAAVVQPGGSIRDAEVIEAADAHGLAMVFTGERHFRH